MIGYECPCPPVKYLVDFGGYRIAICDNVYEPAEDSWLTLETAEELLARLRSKPIIVDVGAGTGVIGLGLASGASYVVAIDVNPCAVLCSLESCRASSLGHLVDVVQCDNITCLRRTWSRPLLIVYNTPYLPTEDSDLLGLSWSGGDREAKRVIRLASEMAAKELHLVVTTSSLSANIPKLMDYTRSLGLNVVGKKVKHYFFEDIIVLILRGGK